MKRVLFINAFVIGENSGTGNTFYNLFLNCPKECLLQLCVDEKSEKNSMTTINTIYSKKKYYPIDYFVRKHILVKLNKNSSFPKYHGDVKVTFMSAIHDFFRGILDMSIINLPKELVKRIDDFKPEVIYTCGASIRILKITNYFAKRYNKHIIIHLMDDWPETIYTTSFLSCLSRFTILRQLKTANKYSVHNFAISPFLAEKYEKVYKKPYIDLMNPAVEIVENYNERKSSIIRFTYAGSLSLNRWQSLLKIAQILQDLNIDGFKNQFYLYIPRNLNTLENKKQFSEKDAFLFDYVSPNEVGKVYAGSDILVFTESFDERISKYTKYSLSTKIPEYMGAGKPILAYIPKVLLSGDYIRSNNVGLVANNSEELKNCIIRLITDRNLRRCLAENGIKCAQINHSIQNANRKLRNVIDVSTKY